MPASDASPKRQPSRALALVPVLVAIVFGALLLPRAASPDAVPLPRVDRAKLSAVEAADDARARDARARGLPDDARVLGGAIRDFHTMEARGEGSFDVARQAIDRALAATLTAGGDEALLALRAVQLESFLDETRAFERTGKQSPELLAVAGPFVRRMQLEGWAAERTIEVPETVRRVMFKEMWNALLSLDRAPFAATLDEERALYAFYLERPHASAGARGAMDAARRGARDARQCEALDAGERLAIETWRLDKVEKLAQMDPSYPADYARGVVHYRRGEFEASAEAFRRWLDAHPRGAWSLRAQDHLKAALERARAS